MTPEDYQILLDLINRNLAGVPKIAPDKHREVEIALLNAIKLLSQQSILTLNQGMIHIGDINTTDKRYTHTIPDVGTDQYFVIGSIAGASGFWDNSNDVFWTWGEPTRTSFAIYFREITNQVQDVNFWYMLIPKTF